MARSKEVNEAVGEAPNAAELLDAKTIELAQAEAALHDAETRMDVSEVVRLQNIVGVLRRMVSTLRDRAAVEAVAEAREDAVAFDATLRKRYDEKLDRLMPDIEVARLAIKKMGDAVRKCAKTWHVAARAKYELELLAMRFGLESADLDALPMSPLDAVHAAFGEEMETLEPFSRKDTLPVVVTVASDSPEQLTAKGMVAAAEHVQLYGQALKLSADLLALFAKAGPIASATPRSSERLSRPSEPLSSGADIFLLPPGAVQSALGPTPGPVMPETPTERTRREEEQRAVARRRANVAREMTEDAKRLKAGPPTASGPLKGVRE